MEFAVWLVHAFGWLSVLGVFDNKSVGKTHLIPLWDKKTGQTVGATLLLATGFIQAFL